MPRRKPSSPEDLPPAPGELRLIQAFLNTVDREAETDDLATPRGLADFLARHGLLPPGTELSAAERERAVAVREGWRSLIAGSAEERQIAALDSATAAAGLRGRHGPGGVERLEPTAGGLDGALGRMIAIALEARIEKRWRLLKVCASPDCRAVFYDHSTNHTGRWCRPRCGNRLSARASKRRKRRLKKKDREAAARSRSKIEYKPPSLADLEADPVVGDLARRLREREEREKKERGGGDG